MQPALLTLPRHSLPRQSLCAHKATASRLQARSIPPDHPEFNAPEGGSEIQDALMQQLSRQLKNQTLKDEIREDLKGRVEEMKQIGDELKRKLDEKLTIEKFRTELESTESLADTMDKFKEVELELEQIKQQIKADRQDLAKWEREAAAARSQGLFFKSLYVADEDGDGSSSRSTRARGASGLDPDVAARTAAARAQVQAPAAKEVASPLRLWLFAYMAAVLLLVAAQDVASGASKPVLDGLYAVLAIILGINSWNERWLLVGQHQQEEQRRIASVQPPIMSQVDEARGQKPSEQASGDDNGGRDPPHD